MADQKPQIQLIAPLAPVVLVPGGKPQIQWQATDDYGLSAMVLEQVEGTRRSHANRTVVMSSESGREARLGG